MKELFRVSMLVEGPSIGKVKIPKALTKELVKLTEKGSKLLDTVMDKTIEEFQKEEDYEQS